MNHLQFCRALVILNGAVPLVMLAWDAYRGQLGANSINYALHVTGILSLVFLFLSLLMTPLRWFTSWGGWIAFRRSLGLYGFFYSVLHLGIYVGFDRSLSLTSTLHEIWVRRFLQVGIAALLLMIPLAITSTNSMLRSLGPKRWKSLHRAAYLVAILGVVHYYMLVKSDVRQPLAFGSVLAVLLGARVVRHYFEIRRSSSKRSVTDKVQKMVIGKSFAELERPASIAAKPRQQWKGELKVAAIFQETPDVKTFRLTALDGQGLPFTYLPGQFMNIQLEIDGKRVNRSYTIASAPTRSDACELSIKREPRGLASQFIHDRIRVGDVLKVSAPAGKFVFTGQEAASILLIAGGVGITPLMSIIRYLTDRAWSGKINFLIVAKSEEDLIFREEIQWLKRRFSNLNLCMTLTRVDAESMWQGDRGRANAELLLRFVPDLFQLPIYLCGPNEMMDATQELLLGMGVPKDKIKTEAFGAKNGTQSTTKSILEQTTESQVLEMPVTTQSVAVSRMITFSRSKVQTEISSETSVLEAAEAASIELPYECRSGICGQCKTRLIEGNVIMDCEDALSAAEKASGLILACQALPRSHLVVEA